MLFVALAKPRILCIHLCSCCFCYCCTWAKHSQDPRVSRLLVQWGPETHRLVSCTKYLQRWNVVDFGQTNWKQLKTQFPSGCREKKNKSKKERMVTINPCAWTMVFVCAGKPQRLLIVINPIGGAGTARATFTKRVHPLFLLAGIEVIVKGHLLVFSLS